MLVDGRSALKRALVEDEGQFKTLMEGGFERYVAPRTLEEYLAEKCPEGLSRVKAWLDANGRREKVVTKKEVRVGRVLSETSEATLSYGHVTESVEFATVGSGEVSSEQATESTISSTIPSTTATEAESMAESNDRFEDYAVGIMRNLSNRLFDFEYEVCQFEYERGSPDDIRLLLDLRHSLEAMLAELDTLFEGEREENVTRPLRSHRRHMTHRVLAGLDRTDQLLESVVYE